MQKKRPGAAKNMRSNVVLLLMFCLYYTDLIQYKETNVDFFLVAGGKYYCPREIAITVGKPILFPANGVNKKYFLHKIYISILFNLMENEIEKQEERKKLESCTIKTIMIAFPPFYWDKISPFLLGH